MYVVALVILISVVFCDAMSQDEIESSKITCNRELFDDDSQ